jgi:hypothetical protein
MSIKYKENIKNTLLWTLALALILRLVEKLHAAIARLPLRSVRCRYF